MAHSYTTLAKFAIDLQDGSGMRIFTRQPNDMKIRRAGEADTRLDGTENTPMFWTMDLIYKLMRKDHFREFTEAWDPRKQRVIVNYPSGKHLGLGATGSPGSGWVSDQAVWRDPPMASNTLSINGIIVLDYTLTLYRFEWDGANPLY